MIDGQNNGSYTIDSAQQAIRGLLSHDREDAQSRESQPEPEVEETDETATAEDEQPEQPADGEETDEVEETDEEPVQPRVRRLKIDGKDVEVTDEELEKGYLRQSDYTRKTQELSSKRKTFDEQELPQVRAERQQLAAYFQQLENVIKSYQPDEPDWETLRLQDPDEFGRQWADWQLRQKRLTAVAEAKRQAQEKVAADQAEQFKTYLQGEQSKLLEKVPTWSDPKVARAEKARLLSYAQENGFSEDELKQVADHRALVMLRKAMLYDEAQTKKPALQQKIDAVKTAKPGSANQPSRTVTELTRQKQRLAKTGSVDDAAEVIKTMLAASRKGPRR